MVDDGQARSSSWQLKLAATVQNAFWGVVTNPNGQHTVLGAPTGLKPPIW